MSIAEALPATVALHNERNRQSALVAALSPATPTWIRQLTWAADQFLVRRADGGASVIAGYPWFTDWGRDTMIALPGLTLATGRVAEAAAILRSFAAHLSDGMLPNRFPDGGEAPEYNTVDATLWYFAAVGAYVSVGDDRHFAEELFPVLADIVAWHDRGTRYGIHVDSHDQLLAAGSPDVQLTWMDARVGARVVTPRSGKAVEINALWQHALRVMRALARRLGHDAAARDYDERATAHARAFAERFWYADGGYLYDVVDTPDGGDDARLRPNQIFAVALSDALLDDLQRRAVVATCQRELWTPFGLRSLARHDPDYCGRYVGGPRQRDAVYHQGTVWSWLAGPFARAHHLVHGDADAALGLLEPLAAHLHHTGLGSVSEIFDGDAPHAARGCFAQAWSVATLLEAWHAVQAPRAVTNSRETPS